MEVHLALDAGTHHDLVLEISDQTLPRLPVPAAEAWQPTESSWAGAVPEPGPSLATKDSRHSYAGTG
jgi:alpha,alpha-trehalase